MSYFDLYKKSVGTNLMYLYIMKWWFPYDVDMLSEDGLLRTETCKGVYTYKYNLITLGGVNEVVLIVQISAPPPEFLEKTQN
jgi:hypothetical protein